MPKFTVVYVKGRAVSTGMSFDFEPSGPRSMLELQASSRADAYMEAYRHLTRLGLSISVEKNTSTVLNPLGLSDGDVAKVEQAGVPLDTRAASGVRIIKIVKLG